MPDCQTFWLSFLIMCQINTSVHVNPIYNCSQLIRNDVDLIPYFLYVQRNKKYTKNKAEVIHMLFICSSSESHVERDISMWIPLCWLISGRKTYATHGWSPGKNVSTTVLPKGDWEVYLGKLFMFTLQRLATKMLLWKTHKTGITSISYSFCTQMVLVVPELCQTQLEKDLEQEPEMCKGLADASRLLKNPEDSGTLPTQRPRV